MCISQLNKYECMLCFVCILVSLAFEFFISSLEFQALSRLYSRLVALKVRFAHPGRSSRMKLNLEIGRLLILHLLHYISSMSSNTSFSTSLMSSTIFKNKKPAGNTKNLPEYILISQEHPKPARKHAKPVENA